MMNVREKTVDGEYLKQRLMKARSDLSKNTAKVSKAKCVVWGVEIVKTTWQRVRMSKEHTVDGAVDLQR